MIRRALTRWLFALCGIGIAGPVMAQTPPNPSLPAETYSAEVATEWFALAQQLTQQTPGMSPPVASRALAYLSLTLYESVVAGMPGHRSLAGQLNELQSLPWAQPDEALHWPTVAHSAMAGMTRMMFPTRAPRTARASTCSNAACRRSWRATLTRR